MQQRPSLPAPREQAGGSEPGRDPEQRGGAKQHGAAERRAQASAAADPAGRSAHHGATSAAIKAGTGAKTSSDGMRRPPCGQRQPSSRSSGTARRATSRIAADHGSAPATMPGRSASRCDGSSGTKPSSDRPAAPTTRATHSPATRHGRLASVGASSGLDRRGQRGRGRHSRPRAVRRARITTPTTTAPSPIAALQHQPFGREAAARRQAHQRQCRQGQRRRTVDRHDRAGAAEPGDAVMADRLVDRGRPP